MPADGAMFSDADSEPLMEFMCLLCASDVVMHPNVQLCEVLLMCYSQRNVKNSNNKFPAIISSIQLPQKMTLKNKSKLWVLLTVF